MIVFNGIVTNLSQRGGSTKYQPIVQSFFSTGRLVGNNAPRYYVDISAVVFFKYSVS
jgi:hypothetical protein